jgi:Pentapeptide repeats (8 copies)
MKFDIKNRFTGALQFTAEIDCPEDAPSSIKIGLAVKWAIKTRAYLAGAYLSGANLTGTNLAGANLTGAYLSGADLSGANLAGAYLSGADLAGAYLADAHIVDANLTRADLAGADLAGADLTGANLADANLADANLAGANLDANLADANLADALKISAEEIPVIPNIDAAILAAIEAGGTLDMSFWHGSCGTTHCRAGWAIHLAGEKGKALEDRIGSQMAGTLIYQASRPKKPAPWFFASNEEAMEDIRKCAAEEAAEALPEKEG